MQVRNVRLWAAALLAVVLAAASAPTIAYARPGSENESYARDEWRALPSHFKGRRAWQNIDKGLTRIEEHLGGDRSGRSDTSSLSWLSMAQQLGLTKLDSSKESTTKSAPRTAKQNQENDLLPGAYYSFIPHYMGSAFLDKPPTSWQADKLNKTCYKDVSLSFESLAESNNGTYTASLTFKLSNWTGDWLCNDIYLIGTPMGLHIQDFTFLAGLLEHKITWTNLSKSQADEMSFNGVRVFMISEGIIDEVVSIFETVTLFLGLITKEVPDAIAKENVEFLRDYAGIDLQDRGNYSTKTIEIPDEDINSGDMFCILRLDGLDPLISWGSASPCGHTTMALRIRGILYIVESQAKSSYWPTNFVQKTPYKEWLKLAAEADYNVVYLPLGEAQRAKFQENEDSVVSLFLEEYEGLLYGYANLLFCWLDLGNDNIPDPLDLSFVEIAFALIDPLLTPILSGGSPPTPSLWNDAFAQRLGINVTGNYTTNELLELGRAQNKTFLDLVTMPEQDDYIYPGAEGEYPGGKVSVCNVFVCRMWKAAGLLGDLDIQCAEFTPLDNVQLKIFDENYDPPQECKTADPMNTKFCQIMGKYRLELPHYNYIEPFDHMREKCPSKAPSYQDRFSSEVDNSC